MKGKIATAVVLALLCSCGSHKELRKDNVAPPTTVTGTATKKPKPATRETEYKGAQWVRNVSSLSQPTKGLRNRHISVWASHGRFFNIAKDRWEWQRPNLFGTNEDLFTQTIVVPYLIPMLEKAGATVFTPRERDWQENEIIVDNDDEVRLPYYSEQNILQKWTDGGCSGFANPTGGIVYANGNPFNWGTTRKAKASKEDECSISYQPSIKESGKYAVYVSYPTVKQSVSDAEYTVWHKGERTVFNVNQRIGGGTWVYLGSFDFGAGCSPDNRVVLTNRSEDKGFVTADAVRFGGGMGNINRHGTTSGLPRCLEGARYYAQWAGAPDSVYNSKDGTDDYKDDINTRSLMTNWLAGGSCYVPDQNGKGVPFELSLAVHSDAGYAEDLKSIYGSLAICTTNTNNGMLSSGKSRLCSKEFATQLLNGMQKDLSRLYGKWATRDLYDRNYSETRCPKVPSAIIETLSHQSFPDMIMAQDPNVKFNIARSLYKTILRFIAKQHNKQYTVSPLAPLNLNARFTDEGTVELRWDQQVDIIEESARPTGFILYTAKGDGGFDNGRLVKDCHTKVMLIPGEVYSFKVTAINKGGESFPSETATAVYQPEATKTILVVNGFHRLSSPAIRETATEQGFDFDADPGVSYGATYGWSGKQIAFDKTKAGLLNEAGLGFSGNEMEGSIIMGNTFDYAVEHAKAIASAKKYNVVSCSSKNIENGSVDMGMYACVDYILGLERYLAMTPTSYKALTGKETAAIERYANNGGRLLVSGAYIVTDMRSEGEREFLRRVLHVGNNNTSISSPTVRGMGTDFFIYNEQNKQHYAATSCDVLSPEKPAFCALTYGNGMSACVAYKDNRKRTITMGFPFECITSEKKQGTIMRGLLQFLLD